MGWLAIDRQFNITREETHGRPVQQGEEGNLLVIAQEDFGRTVAIDLVNGLVAIDYNHLAVQNGTIELANDKFRFLICEETNIIGEMFDLEQKLDFARDPETGRKVLENGKYVKVRTDVLHPLVWRPIWFTRYTNGVPTKVIGAQVTLPKIQGGKNIKKMLSIFENGMIGID